ncbi:MAG: cytochrome c1 [Hyphomonadaceae bacterium]|nr:cytochrome c1 [Hyphomonadaceae bacterium]
MLRLVKNKVAPAAALVGMIAGGLTISHAAGSYDFDYEMKYPHWHFEGPFGTYDRAAMQRGYQIYREVCAACHGLEHVSFRHLGDKGGPYYDENYPDPNSNPYVKAFAADWLIQDIDSETGDTIERQGTPADKFPPIYPNDAAAAGSNGGAIPPDLSVMVSARGGGADYLYNLLIAYDEPKPEKMVISPGTYFNPVMDGGAIAMAAPLIDDIVEYADGTPATVDQMAADVTEFLAWTADPKMEARKNTGLMTMIYLTILAVLMWFSYRRVWRNVEH